MSHFKGLLNPYRLFWLILVALFGCFMWWWLFLKPQNPVFTNITPEEVQRDDLDNLSPPAQSIDERAGPMSLDVSKANMTISSTNGELEMRVWADKATKDADVTTIKHGALEFILKDRGTLLLEVSDTVLRMDNKEGKVADITASGNLIGQLLPRDRNVQGSQYFSAEELSWDRATTVIVAKRVRYIGPGVQVDGQQMSIDLDTSEVKFEGPVKAGIDAGSPRGRL